MPRRITHEGLRRIGFGACRGTVLAAAVRTPRPLRTFIAHEEDDGLV
jgi:hypothetical protein